jgi:signal transduction histidine kinase
LVLAHVLFDGDIRRHPALRSLFWQWGVTVGRLPASVGVGDQATVEDCDAVVHLCSGADPTGFVSGAMPDGAEAEGVAAAEAAPLLVIGAGPVAAVPWITIPDPGPEGTRLKAALQSCQERTRMLRGDSHSRHDLDQFRNFLGHELRSPLTAIKTALTVLETEGSDEPGSARMLRIALRNLIRLTETVEWSQELMSLAEAPPTAELGPVSLASLAEAIPDHLDVHLDEKHESCEVLTDPRLLGILAGQMERVLANACPGSRPVFVLALDPGSGDCRLSAMVSRTGGMEAGHDLGDFNRAEFDHLVRMLISPQLLQALGVKPRIPAEDRAEVELTVGLPSCAGTLSPAPGPLFTV